MALKFIVPAFFAALLAAGACHAQIYKWTDERGLVHYSSTPPANGEVVSKRIEPVDERVTVYSSSSSSGSDDREIALRRRVDALEQELASQRQERVAQADDGRSDERRKREFEECQRQRRVDCDKPEVIQNGAPAAVVIGARRRPPVPVAPPVAKPAPAPVGGIKLDSTGKSILSRQ